jgi:hypothetical protein
MLLIAAALVTLLTAITHSYFGEKRLIDWLDDMINRRFVFGSDWRSVTCAPDCIP